MFDSLLRPAIAPQFDKLADKLVARKFTANQITYFGLFVGFVGCFAVGMAYYIPGLVLLIAAFLLDGLDGAVARKTQATELGAWLDMICSVVLFAAFPLFFMFSDLEQSMAAGIVLFGYLLMGMANLSYDYFAMKKNAPPARSGIVETAEIATFMFLCCLYPPGFSFFAAFIALLSLAAAILRMISTAKLLKN